MEKEKVVTRLKVADIEPDPNQPRKVKTAEHITSLAQSIKAKGLETPIKVRSHPDEKKAGKFMVVWGECRYRAHGEAGLKTIDCFVEEYASEADVFMAQVVENGVREDLPPMDQADSYLRAFNEFDFSLDEIAFNNGKSLTTISADIVMARIESPVIRNLINDGTIPKAIGRELATFDDTKILTAWKWAKEEATVKKMMAQIDAYRQEDGQQVMGLGYDYTQKKDEMKKVLVTAGKNYDLWMDRCKLYMKKATGETVGHAVSSRDRSLDTQETFIKALKKFAEGFEEEINKCRAKIKKNEVAVA